MKNGSADDFPECLNISQNETLVTEQASACPTSVITGPTRSSQPDKPNRPRKYPTFRVNKKP